MSVVKVWLEETREREKEMIERENNERLFSAPVINDAGRRWVCLGKETLCIQRKA